ncbi:Hsp20/alpha crystallin family protein [Fulvivirga sp. M361]|uniref:Hsp20/alpha crystallin family protein n=1 Tax=Fulvivirga sp. M361 TaxID=2594266 RepID=UPI00117AEDCD|nr:Hsp20/alpha crystallin family protein [Fulvivirga sp. M361]TRX45296.1 Hsp20/alpha crystallin family protein [Fulvivirga sp. M361]
MTLIKRTNPLFPTFFDDFFGQDTFNFGNRFPSGSTVPAVNIKEDTRAYLVEVAAPGVDKKDFKVEVDHDLLTISYEKKESKEEKGDYTKREFSYQSFQRSFNLPQTVESGKIEAKYTDGILHLSIPKKEASEPKPSRLIEIS